MTYLLTTHDKFCGPSCHDLSMVWNQDWVTAIFSHVQPQFQKRFDFFFLIHSVENSTKAMYLSGYLIYLIVLCKYTPFLNLIAAACSKQVGTGARKDGESCAMRQNTCLDQSTGKQVHW